MGETSSPFEVRKKEHMNNVKKVRGQPSMCGRDNIKCVGKVQKLLEGNKNGLN